MTFFACGAIATGGLVDLIFNGWVVALAAIFGGVWGVFIAACYQVAGAETQKEYRLHSNLVIMQLSQEFDNA